MYGGCFELPATDHDHRAAENILPALTGDFYRNSRATARGEGWAPATRYRCSRRRVPPVDVVSPGVPGS